MVEGSEDKSYELDKREEKHFHIRCGQKVHDSAKQEYVINYRVIKLTQANYDKIKKAGGFKQFAKVEILHMPKGTKAKVQTPTTKAGLTSLRADYKLLFDADAPEELKENDLVNAIEEMSTKRLEEVQALYKTETKNEPKKKGALEMLKELFN